MAAAAVGERGLATGLDAVEFLDVAAVTSDLWGFRVGVS